MTDRDELELLQQRARDSGKVCNFFQDTNGYIDQVYFDGQMLDPLSFAELARRMYGRMRRN